MVITQNVAMTVAAVDLCARYTLRGEEGGATPATSGPLGSWFVPGFIREGTERMLPPLSQSEEAEAKALVEVANMALGVNEIGDFLDPLAMLQAVTRPEGPADVLGQLGQVKSDKI